MFQTPGDLYILEEYRAWADRQPEAVRRSPAVLEAYRAFLLEKGLDGVDADQQIRVIAALDEPAGFPAALIARRKPGRAVVNGNAPVAEWLRGRGWQVVAAPAKGELYDLILGAAAEALRPGGLLIVPRAQAARFPALKHVWSDAHSAALEKAAR
jgi:hypothetical protein